ncbi:Uncharacterized protein TCM_013790 [Theobroma cacao]|uniref:Uncharacterized protein n=1 Tax=Theobroma cacao TaxID=3641 RepID=A0A061G3X5_THECC|nr:Uncharacterized protein TCM_013790 [Theobroma cacao]
MDQMQVVIQLKFFYITSSVKSIRIKQNLNCVNQIKWSSPYKRPQKRKRGRKMMKYRVEFISNEWEDKEESSESD